MPLKGANPTTTWVTVKHKPDGAYVRSEAEMMHFASQKGLLAPRVLGCYDVEPEVIATVTDVIPGASLDKSPALSEHTAEKTTSKTSSRSRCVCFGLLLSPISAGSIARKHLIFFDRLHFHFMGPFESEEELDEFCLARAKSPTSRSLWRLLLPGMREKSPSSSTRKFVLTHGDLAARNIMVHNGELSGIVDWEYSGFYPEYMENALATVIHDQHEEWWLPVLKEILEPCGFKRSRFMAALKDRGW
ncbi:hypothetical protein BDV19DRAFT_372479 [Aspergillus venezuelensis]